MAMAIDMVDLRTEIAAYGSPYLSIYRAMLIQAGAIVGAVVAIMRLIGE